MLGTRWSCPSPNCQASLHITRRESQVWIWGRISDNREHRHQALQVCVAAKGAAAALHLGSECTKGRGLVVRGGIAHALHADDGLVVLVDSSSALATRIHETVLRDRAFGQFETAGWDGSLEHGAELLDSLARGPAPTTDSRVRDVMRWLDALETTGRWFEATLAGALERAQLSRSRFLHLFSEEVGSPWRTYLVWRRAQVAMSAASVGASLTEAAHFAGYADLAHFSRQELVEARKWRRLTKYERIGATYDFVKDEIAFGYNSSDDLPASAVLADGYGQCNTKGNLLVALLRSVGIPARFHGFTIDKSLQKGAIPSWLYPLAPSRILHSWVEVSWEGEWVPLEGFILDGDYLRALQERFPDAKSFCGYGAATTDLQDPPVEWRGRPTFVQKEGIAEDFGVFDDPDGLYQTKGTNLSGVRRFLYVNVFRHAMNATVARTRRSRSREPSCDPVQQSN